MGAGPRRARPVVDRAAGWRPMHADQIERLRRQRRMARRRRHAGGQQPRLATAVERLERRVPIRCSVAPRR
ncbi:MAG: hypothetical protein ACK56F_13035, partial [bacterium]